MECVTGHCGMGCGERVSEQLAVGLCGRQVAEPPEEGTVPIS